MTNERRNLPDLPTAQGGGDLAPPGGYYYPPTSYAGAAGPEEGLDWQRLASLLWARKWWILGITLVVGAGTWFATRYFMEPQYEARATIYLDEAQNRGGPIQPEDVFEGEGWANLLRSRAVLEPVVERHNLYAAIEAPADADPDLFSSLTVREGQLVSGTYTLYVDSADFRLVHEERGLVQTGSTGQTIGGPAGFSWSPSAARLANYEELQFTVRPRLQAALGLRGSLSSQYDGRSNLITATLVWNDRQQAAELLNSIVEQFIDTATELKNRKIAEVVQILEQQTEYAAQELREKELALERFRVQTITEPTEPQAGAIPGGSETRRTVYGQYFDQRLESREIETHVDRLQRVLSQTQEQDSLDVLALQSVPAVNQDPALQQAIQELREKEANRRAALYTYTEQAPEVQNLTEEITTLRQQTIPSMVVGLVNELQTRNQMLGEQMGAQAQELRQIPTRSIEEARRQRDFELAEDLHNRLLSRLREAQLARATSLPDMEIVDAATPPFGPLEDEAPRFILMASMAAFGLAVGGILLHDHMDKRIRYPEQVTHKLGLPILGVVPRLESRARSLDPTLASIAVESFRSIRTQIAHSQLGPSDRVVLITSPSPRDGKSMVAGNLAISYASSGRRTVLVDVDTRRGRAQEMFQCAKSPGLSDYLTGAVSLEEALQETEVDDLALIANGSMEGFTPDMLDSQPMWDLLEELRSRYDMVVLDAPPLAAGADTLLVGEYADKVVLVLRAGKTDEEMARTKLDMVGNVDLPFVGAVLNAVPESAPYYEYYADYYYVEPAAAG